MSQSHLSFVNSHSSLIRTISFDYRVSLSLRLTNFLPYQLYFEPVTPHLVIASPTIPFVEAANISIVCHSIQPQQHKQKN